MACAKTCAIDWQLHLMARLPISLCNFITPAKSSAAGVLGNGAPILEYFEAVPVKQDQNGIPVFQINFEKPLLTIWPRSSTLVGGRCVIFVVSTLTSKGRSCGRKATRNMCS